MVRSLADRTFQLSRRRDEARRVDARDGRSAVDIQFPALQIPPRHFVRRGADHHEELKGISTHCELIPVAGAVLVPGGSVHGERAHFTRLVLGWLAGRPDESSKN